MFKRVPDETKREILEKIKNGATVAQTANQYAISVKTIYGWLANETRPAISVVEYNRLKRENEELKRIVGLITWEMERGKKIKIIKTTCNKKLIANCMKINHKNIYHQNKKDMRDLAIKDQIEQTLHTKHPPKIFHSDRGGEYLSPPVIDFLENIGIKISVSDPGSP